MNSCSDTGESGVDGKDLRKSNDGGGRSFREPRLESVSCGRASIKMEVESVSEEAFLELMKIGRLYPPPLDDMVGSFHELELRKGKMY